MSDESTQPIEAANAEAPAESNQPATTSDNAGSYWADRTFTIFKREFCGYFRTPIAYVFLCVVLVLLNGITWSGVGGFFQGNNASLQRFFDIFPWVFLLLIPAVGMRLWAEERRSGTWELLFTYPVTVAQAVIAKFLAAWAFISITILFTFTMPITIALLGEPDWGEVIAGYFGVFLLSGAYLSVCTLASSLTRNQVIAFVIGLIACFVLLMAGFSVWNDYLLGVGAPVWLVDAFANLGFIPHFEPMTKGLILFRDVVYFLAVMAGSLLLNIISLERS